MVTAAFIDNVRVFNNGWMVEQKWKQCLATLKATEIKADTTHK